MTVRTDKAVRKVDGTPKTEKQQVVWTRIQTMLDLVEQGT